MEMERKAQGVGKKARVGAGGGKRVPYSKAFLIALRGAKKALRLNAKKAARLNAKKAAEIKKGFLPHIFIGCPEPKSYGMEDEGMYDLMRSILSYRQ